MFNLLSKFRRPLRHSRRHRAAFLFGEALEVRALLAGNVVASLIEGNLILRGDSQANSVEITVDDGDLVVRGQDGTRINGSSDTFVIADGATTFYGDVRIDLRTGADTFVVNGPLTIAGGIRSFDVSGKGQFAITDAVVEGNVRLHHSGSSDIVSLMGATIDGDLFLDLNNGRNFVSLLDSTVEGELTVWTGNRNDVVLLEGTTLGGLHIATGDWIDDVILKDTLIDGDFLADTGIGRDNVLLDDSTVTGDTELWLGPDSDRIVAQGTVEFLGDFFAGGILGRRDTIELSANTAIEGKQRIVGFEDHSIEDLTGVNGRIGRRVTEATLYRALLNGLDIGDLTLTVDTSENLDVETSNNILVTRADTFLITGTTLPGATINVTAGPGGGLDLGSVTAGSDGSYSITIDLLTGPTTIMVTATDILDRTVTEEFDLHVAAGTVVRFESSQGSFDVELYDEDAPLTVANFLAYSARYADSIAHRSAVTAGGSPFVIQGGGFALNSSDQLQMITTDPPVMSEASSARSNVRGTLSMALGSDGFGMTDPDSGTSQWFVNLRDNSQLNAQGFTVFGFVIGDGMEVLDAIAALDRVDINDVVPLTTAALGEVPLDGYMLQEVQLSGTVSIASNSIQVFGTGTQFTTELEIDDVIVIEGNPYRIVQIVSNTELLVDTSQAAAIVDAPFFTEPIATTLPTRDQYVVFSSIGVLL